ncbi:hypothetical protein SAMN05421783_1095 [Thiocapsa roseopersicina]|uniref:Uncharacterized protein n=1 Tax=Thiocapsa roseopersicina TaxID=1058 RepID=A0A1H2WKH4_THIRO|nr:hypothetical protein SAMN05421783_1095 [Thiocapsa roseopersicina]
MHRIGEIGAMLGARPIQRMHDDFVLASEGL